MNSLLKIKWYDVFLVSFLNNKSESYNMETWIMKVKKMYYIMTTEYGIFHCFSLVLSFYADITYIIKVYFYNNVLY